jgi:hypothetical protein
MLVLLLVVIMVVVVVVVVIVVSLKISSYLVMKLGHLRVFCFCRSIGIRAVLVDVSGFVLYCHVLTEQARLTSAAPLANESISVFTMKTH